MSIKRLPIPTHLRAPEIKRRLAILLKAASDNGFEVGGVRLDPTGEITLLDKPSQSRDSDSETKWLER